MERWQEWRAARREPWAVAQEMRFHIEQETERNMRSGMGPDAARSAALRAFGGVDRYVEQARDERPGSALEDLVADMRYALRWLRKTPGFAAVAMLTLALGIGSNTAIFSVVNAALLKPLPFADPDRLVKVSLVMPDEPDMVWSYPKYEVLRDEQRSFTQVAGYSPWTGTLAGGGDPERLQGERVTARYFDVLGVRPRAGRVFTEEEARDPGRAQVALLGESLWRRRFNADPAVVGRTLQLDGQAVTVVGVLPADFRGLSGNADIFVPVSTIGRMLNGRWAHFMTVIARLDDHVTLERAQTEVVALGARIDELHRSPRDLGASSAMVRRLKDLRVDPAIRRAVLVLFGAVTALLLITCANVANLLLARAAQRRREIAVRLAIGAHRGRLIRQLMTESLIMALLGGLAGVLVAWLGMRALAALAANAGSVLGNSASGFQAVLLARIPLDATVLLFALGATVITGFLFGVVPALQASRADLVSDLKDGGERSRSALGVRGLNSRNVLIISEIALAFTLLVGAGLMLRSLARLLDVDAGLNPRNLLTARISLPESNSPQASLRFWQELLQRSASLPGVHSVGVADCPPLIGRCYVKPFWPDGQTSSAPVPVGVHYVSPGYFDAVGVALRRGRVFTAADRAGSPNVVIINQSAAQKYFPGEDPVGKRVGAGGGFADPMAEIVGVVADQRFAAIEVPAEPDVYIAYAQVPMPTGYLFVRTSGRPLALAAAIRREVQRLDPNLPVYDVQTMEKRVRAATERTRVTGLLLGAFAATALLLALIGIYGLVAYAVTQRTREIGLRIALGAGRADVARLMLPYSALLVGLGLGVGLLGAWSTTRVLRSLLFEVETTDPLVFASLTALTLVVALAASALPAFRAARLDPLTALRSE
ncbi:MAG: ADOP family duplicated permease [Longimicrobiales bacterium]